MNNKVRVAGKSLVVRNPASGKELDGETCLPQTWRNQSPCASMEEHLKKMDLLSEIIRDNQRST